MPLFQIHRGPKLSARFSSDGSGKQAGGNFFAMVNLGLTSHSDTHWHQYVKRTFVTDIPDNGGGTSIREHELRRIAFNLIGNV